MLVHGLWFNGATMALLARRLRRCGFRTFLFSYPSVGGTTAENAARLDAFVQRIDIPVIHFVGHSLGGRVVLALLHHYPEQRPGCIVLLCTPLRASAAAQALARRRLGRLAAGHAADELTRGAELPNDRDIGVVAGTVSVGLGRLISDLRVPNDGAVALAEIDVAGLAHRLTLPVSHSGVLFSAVAASRVCHFLKHGRFGS